MRINKRQSLILAILLVGSFAAGTFFILSQQDQNLNLSGSQSESKDLTSAESYNDALISKLEDKLPKEGANLSMNDFHRVEMRNGKKIWEVKASRGQYFPANNSAVVEAAQLSLFRKDGSVVELNAGSATLFLEGATLNRAEASSGVVLKLDDQTTLTSETAEFDRLKNLVHVPGEVQIVNSRMKLTGASLEADLTKEEFRVFKNVDTTIFPKYSE